MVLDYLKQHPRLHAFSYYDQSLPCSPNLRRPDFVWILPDRIIVLEVDENAHRHYNRRCEIARITELQEQGGALPLRLVRFNPRVSLLEEMARAVERFMDNDITGLLDAVFVGYKQEYDVLLEIQQESQWRRQQVA